MSSEHKIAANKRRRRKTHNNTRVHTNTRSCPSLVNPSMDSSSAISMQPQYYYNYPAATVFVGEQQENPEGMNNACCAAAADAPVIPCMDEECQKLMEEYCQACLDHQQVCEIAGCEGTARCDQCCTSAHCTEVHCLSQPTSSPSLGSASSQITTPSSAESAPLDNSLSFPMHFAIPPTSPDDDYYSFHCHWNHCDFSFTSLFELDNHLLFNHIPPQMEPPLSLPQTEEQFQCQWDECQTKAPTETDLVKHVKQDHLPDTSKEHHQCLWVNENGNVCNMCCPSAEELSHHLETEHLGSGKGSYTCHWENCSRSQKPFTQRQKAIRHVRTHTGLKAYKCDVCGKCFATQEILVQHTRLHTHTRPYECTLCRKKFTTSSALLVHSRVHTGEKPLECKICGKRFGESSNLRKHERVHQGERKFQCQVDGCGKRFLRLDQLKRHAKVHQ